MQKIMQLLMVLILFCAPTAVFGQALDAGIGVNSTVTALDDGESFTGQWERTYDMTSGSVALIADQAGEVKIQYSMDRVNVDGSLTYDFVANINEVHKLTNFRPYYRIVITNTSGSDMTFLRAWSQLGNYGLPVAPANLTIGQDSDAQVSRELSEELDISKGKRAGHILIHKFGNNSDVDAAEDIWEGGGNYTGFPATDIELVEVLSASANDTSAGTGCRTILISGLDASKDMQEETITLSGTTPVDSVNTYSRVFRAVCKTVGTNLTNAGIITVRHTTTTANVFAAVPVGRGQTSVAVYTVPNGYIGMILKYGANMRDTNTNRGGVGFVVQEEGGAQREVRAFNVSTNDGFQTDPYGGLSFPEKTDIKCRALSVNNVNANINCFFDLLLVKQ